MANTEAQVVLSKAFENTIEFIKPKNGKYQITPIVVGNDYVAIAPLAVKKESSIFVPDEESTIGIVVGLGPLVLKELSDAFPIGSTVRFMPQQPICTLDGLYQPYGGAKIILTRHQNILAKVPTTDVVCVVGVDKAKD